MANVQQITAPFIFPGQAMNFGDWLFSSLHQKPDQGYDLTGAPAYPGQLSPELAGTLYPALWGAYNPSGGAGMNFLNNYFQNGWMMGPEIGGKLNNVFTYGGPGGYATDLMHTMAQYGGVGNPAQAMSLAMQYGAPSQVGQPMSLISQFGGYGDWGKMLQQRAQGGGAAANFLAPFLLQGAGGWRAPNMPTAPTGGR